VQSRPQALPVTVCEVTQSPDRFVGTRISFHAWVESDGIERTVPMGGTMHPDTLPQG
jgi:hypothetical protein